MFRYLALGIVVFIFQSAANAQSVELMTFAEVSPVDVHRKFTRPPAPRRSVDAALRSFPTASINPTTPLAPRPFSPSTCFSTPYAPAPWLRAEVERRRRLHFDAMARAACEAGVSLSLLEAVVAQESAYRTLAVSRTGAKGLTQLMPGTAEALGVARPFEPLANLRGGAHYLRRQLDRFRRVDLALAAYNAGPERRALKAGRIPAIAETQTYVRTVLGNWERFSRHAFPWTTPERDPLRVGGRPTGRTADLATFQMPECEAVPFRMARFGKPEICDPGQRLQFTSARLYQRAAQR